MLPPIIDHIPLSQLPDAPLTPISTLYVPPKAQAELDPEMMARLGITIEQILWEEGA